MPNQENLLQKEKTQKQNRIWIRIAAACNNKCVFCLDSFAQDGTFPKEDVIKEQIQQGFKEGYDNRVIISGGEASINPKFPEYIRFARELGYDRVQTVTNGNMFAKEEFCNKVFAAGLQEVTFSFHGHTPALHDYLVATPGAFKKSLKGLIFIKKHYPQIIVNIDIVVNKINVRFLPDIVSFFMKLGIHEFDILQIIPFGRGFTENKEKLFYNISENIEYLKKTWELWKIPGTYMWTNRFPAEAFEGYEDLIQDPRKIKSEVMGEAIGMFEKFIESKGKEKPSCFWEPCESCFQNQYCHDFLGKMGAKKVENQQEAIAIRGEEFPSDVCSKYGADGTAFLKYLQDLKKPLINIPKCLGGTGVYETYADLEPEYKLPDYTYKYIKNLYRKKALGCKSCIHNNSCEGLHINFIRSYGFHLLKPITK